SKARRIEQHASDALGDPARDLPFADGGIDDHAAIFRADPALDVNEAGLGIDLDDAGMRRAGKGDARRLVPILRLEARLHARRKASGLVIRNFGNFAQHSDNFRAARHSNQPASDKNVAWFAVSKMPAGPLDLAVQIS